MTCRYLGKISWVEGLGSTTSLKFGRAKIRHGLGKLSNLSANVCGTNEDIDKL